MSSTITQVQRRAVPQLSESQNEFLTDKIVLKKRENFTRSTSIEKLKKFNQIICSQHYYILPSLLLWLKTSQTLLTSNVEKCIAYIKSMFLICTIRECFEKVKKLDAKDKSFAAICELSTKELLPVLSLLLYRIKLNLSLIYEDIKHYTLIATIYLGVSLIFFQLIGCTVLIFFKLPPLGFLFLIGCVLLMSKIAVKVMFQNIWLKKQQKLLNKTLNRNPEIKTIEERRKIRKQLNLIGKTISNVKLF